MSKRYRRNNQATVQRAMPTMGQPGNAVTIPSSVFAAMLQHMAPQKNQASSFSPGTPLAPQKTVMPDAGPRTFSYPIGYNVSGIDRSLGVPDLPSFEQLRTLSRMYSGITLCQRVWFDLIPRMTVKVQLRPDLKSQGMSEKDYQKEISLYRNFFEKPDKVNSIHDWLRLAVKDQLQLDALAIYKRPNRGGGLWGLEIFDGAIVKPLLDERGLRPQVPYPAYQNYPYGIPGDQFTTDQIIYYRESPSTYTPYGFSRVEMIMLLVNQALRKQQKDLARFTEGNIPAGIMQVPETSNWTPDQIDTYEQMWNALTAGNPQQQVRIKFTQPGMKYAPFDQFEHTGHLTEFDQFLLNLACSAHGISLADLAITGDIHKSSDNGQQNMLYRRTMGPLATAYSGIFTEVVRTDFHDDRFIVGFGGFEEAEDLGTLATAYATFAGIGAIAPSDVAHKMQFPDVPKTGPYIMGKEGPIFLADIEEGSELRQAQQASQIAQLQQEEEAPTPPQPDLPPLSPLEERAVERDWAAWNLAHPAQGKRTIAQEKAAAEAKAEKAEADQAKAAAQATASHGHHAKVSPAAKAAAKEAKADIREEKKEERAEAKAAKAAAALIAKAQKAAAHAVTTAAKAHTRAELKAAKALQTLTTGLSTKLATYTALAARPISKTWTAQDAQDAQVIASDLNTLLQHVGSHSGSAIALTQHLSQVVSDLAAHSPKTMSAARQTALDTLAQMVAVNRMTEEVSPSADSIQVLLEEVAGLLRGYQQATDDEASTAIVEPTERDIIIEMNKWRDRAIQDIRRNRTLRGFTTTIIPEHLYSFVYERLLDCETVDDAREVFRLAREEEMVSV